MNVTSSGVWMEPGTGRLLDELRRAYPETTIALSDHGNSPLFCHTHCTSYTREEVIPLPKIVSLANGLLKWGSCRRAVRRLEARADVLLVQLPFDSPFALIGLRRPTLFHACADLRTVSRHSRFRGPLRIAAHIAAAGIDALYFRMVNDKAARLVANGEELYRKYGKPRGKWVMSSTISQREITSVVRKRPNDAPFRILYVGFLRRQKGIHILIDAFRRLQDDIPFSELHIVGEADLLERAVVEDTCHQIGFQGRQSSVRLLGHIPFGPVLFQCLADADVLALPSLGEGTPRVLMEARAFGCPVVATDVGGIRSSIDRDVDGLLVPPNDVDALRGALLRIHREPFLKQRLIENGLKKARRSTVESFAGDIVQELDALASSVVGGCG